MPSAKIGEKTSLDRKQFLELGSKGDKVKIRIVSTDYHYEGKHFMQDEKGNWDVTDCQRVNKGEKCELCEKFFELNKKRKEAEAEKNVKEAKKLEGMIRGYKPTLSFYYRILDRETKAAAVFKTRLSVRLAIEEQVENGVDVLNYDYIVKRTEKPGNYYTLDRVDSSETPKLTKDEVGEIEKAKAFNLEEMVGGKKGSMDFEPRQEVPQEETEEDFDVPDDAVDF